MANGTFYYPSALQGGDLARARLPNAQWYNGVNPGAGKNIGIGINIGGGALPEITGENSIGYNWTLKQQVYNFLAPSQLIPRTPQGACPIGCYANVSRTGDVETTWDVSQPSYTPAGAASSGGDSSIFSYFGSIGVGSNPDNAEGSPVEGAAPIDIGEATLATLVDGWENVVSIEP
jgi:hypothetical protein